MSNKILCCAVGLLSAACAAQAYYIHSQKKEAKAAAAVEPSARRQDEWISEARKRVMGKTPVPFQKFDELFDDDFFGRRFDPFAEIESFHKRMAPFMSEEQRLLFGRSWNDWLIDRMDMTEIQTESATTDDEVVVSLKIPGLEGESLKVDVNDDRIRIAYDAKVVDEGKNKRGAYRSETVRRFEKIMPVPADADPRKNRIVQEGSRVKIIFERRARRAEKA